MTNEAIPSVPAIKSRMITEARPVAYWIDQFSANGIRVSARRIKELAREHKCFCPFTEPMLLLPEHVDQLFAEALKCRSNSISEEKHGGSKGASMNSPKANTIAKAREKLKKRMRELS
ncbi:hypothetical protein WNY59_09645 [Ahrensia kielensis]|uniref:Uncharacterized protein n=1 Tax=Ahrensia kielensis TaxID=76980 RepID=A0ABU9T6W3_9HYPH